jgi:hypothetical protein
MRNEASVNPIDTSKNNTPPQQSFGFDSSNNGQFGFESTNQFS